MQKHSVHTPEARAKISESQRKRHNEKKVMAHVVAAGLSNSLLDLQDYLEGHPRMDGEDAEVLAYRVKYWREMLQAGIDKYDAEQS